MTETAAAAQIETRDGGKCDFCKTTNEASRRLVCMGQSGDKYHICEDCVTKAQAALDSIRPPKPRLCLGIPEDRIRLMSEFGILNALMFRDKVEAFLARGDEAVGSASPLTLLSMLEELEMALRIANRDVVGRLLNMGEEKARQLTNRARELEAQIASLRSHVTDTKQELDGAFDEIDGLRKEYDGG